MNRTPLPPSTGPSIDRLAKALAFLCGADHPVTVAARKAAADGTAEDAARARKLFLTLKPGLQRAVLTMVDLS